MPKKYQRLSIVVPTLNEAGNIAPLVNRINTALEGYEHEIIFIDDHSTDGTVKKIRKVKNDNTEELCHIRVFNKTGVRGKAFSLLEGFEKAKFENICMIDADLQYPPEAIPAMLRLVESGTDVVVANREAHDTGFIRESLSRVGRKVYGKLLYGFDCDVQSGLKLFRMAVLDDFSFNSTPWTFDLTFLFQARENGYCIDCVPIPFNEREYGDSKVNVFGTGFEILFEAVKFKLYKRKLVTSVGLNSLND